VRIAALCIAVLVAGPAAAAAAPEGPIGYASLYGGTTGGHGGEVVVVSDFTALAAAVADPEPRVVVVAGTIVGDGTRMVKVGSNTTIIGRGSDAVLRGFGLDINGWTAGVSHRLGGDCEPEHENDFEHVSNVIVRNLSFVDSTDDSVSIRCYSHNVWVDHNTFHESKDGSVDVKRGADRVTVSWNHFVRTDKTMILGHNDENGAQDADRLHVTYHHNWFENSVQRHPRVRYGHAHIFNNYAELPRSYFVGAGVESHLLLEANYVLSDKDEIKIVKAYGGTDATFGDGNIVQMIRGADEYVLEVKDGDFDRVTEYEYTLDDAAGLPEKVSAGAGAGVMDP